MRLACSRRCWPILTRRPRGPWPGPGRPRSADRVPRPGAPGRARRNLSRVRRGRLRLSGNHAERRHPREHQHGPAERPAPKGLRAGLISSKIYRTLIRLLAFCRAQRSLVRYYVRYILSFQTGWCACLEGRLTRGLGGTRPDLGWDEDPEPDPAGGERLAWSAGFAKGAMADGLPGGSELAFLAGAAAGEEDRYPGATDAELDGAIAAWDRVEAHASARKHLAIAEFIRRRPEQGCEPAGPGGMPARWGEFAADELRVLLAESKATVERMLDRAHSLASRLPGTMAQYRSGKLRESKVMIIVDVTEPLDEQESRAAEELVLGRAGRLTPGRAAPGGRAGGDGSRPGQGQEAARGRREGRPGGAVGRGLRQ